MTEYKHWNVTEQTQDMYVCIDCQTEISEELYLSEKQDDHRYFKITLNRETGIPSWHPYYPNAETETTDPQENWCTLQDYTRNTDMVCAPREKVKYFCKFCKEVIKGRLGKKYCSFNCYKLHRSEKKKRLSTGKLKNM